MNALQLVIKLSKKHPMYIYGWTSVAASFFKGSLLSSHILPIGIYNIIKNVFHNGVNLERVARSVGAFGGFLVFDHTRNANVWFLWLDDIYRRRLMKCQKNKCVWSFWKTFLMTVVCRARHCESKTAFIIKR